MDRADTSSRSTAREALRKVEPFEGSTSRSLGARSSAFSAQWFGQEHHDPLPARLLRPTAGTIGAFGLDATRDGVALRRRLTYVPGSCVCPTDLPEWNWPPVSALAGCFDPPAATSSPSDCAWIYTASARSLDRHRRKSPAARFLFDAELIVLDEPTMAGSSDAARVPGDVGRRARPARRSSSRLTR